MDMNPWLVFSLILFGIWLIIFIFRARVRKEMLMASFFTMPFGLTEPFFVPEYWSPPSLFDLASRTGFDLESLIFSFAVGGIGSVIYETIFKVTHVKMSEREILKKKHRFHLFGLFSPIIVFLPLHLFTSLNPIYSVSIAMVVGGIFAMICRPDLRKKVMTGGSLFLGLYFVFFLSFNLAYPDAVENYWNTSAISGKSIWGIPFEELLFAFTFGMLWSSAYEHIFWFKEKEIDEQPT
jgi:hypothetical protein